MSLRSTIGWAVTLLTLTFVGVVGSFGYSVWLVARSFSQIPTAIIAGFLEAMASYLQVVIALELISMGIVWTVQGPLPSLAWVASRWAAWSGN